MGRGGWEVGRNLGAGEDYCETFRGSHTKEEEEKEKDGGKPGGTDGENV